MSSIAPISFPAGSVATQADVSEVESRPVVAVLPTAPIQPQVAAKRSPEDEKRQAKAAAEQIESYLRHVNTNLEFRVDDAAGKVVVSVREQATGELIRQIPSEEALAIAAQLDEYQVSGLLDRKT